MSMNAKKILTLHQILFFLALSSLGFGQEVAKEKMKLLHGFVGEWVGTSKGYEGGEQVREEPAYESIGYDLDSSILVVQLNSESLQLHTIIYYDEKDETYYYYPFSKRGVNRARAIFEDGRLIVQPTDYRRYIFDTTPEGGFREYGERLIDGRWIKYFQDDFVNTQ